MQLNVKAMIERAERYFPGNAIITRATDGALKHATYGALGERVRRLASALAALGLAPGEKVATLAWNHQRHLELYFAAPCMGAVIHTVNIRLSDEHLIHILNHAQDKVLCVDPDLWALAQRLAPELQTVRQLIVLDDHLPAGSSSHRLCQSARSYETLIAQGDPHSGFPELDEESAAGMCYTSATTGLPKGVLYSQRALYLHAMVLMMADVLAVSEHDTIMPVVPMFHANAWGLPYAATWAGAVQVLPGTHPRADDLLDLIASQRVTLAAAAVTVGVDMLQCLRQRPRDLSSLRGLLLGGQATPKAVMQEFWQRHGVKVCTAWGSTECAPIATFGHVKRHQLDWSAEEQMDIWVRQGIPVPGACIAVRDEKGCEVPWDDQRVGEVCARGPWIAEGYADDPQRSAAGFVAGWWQSGDMATVDTEGVLRLVDRAKDLVKSGGEWISSVALENQLMAHPAVQEAAVVVAPDPKWQERPVAYVVLRPGKEADEATLRQWLGKHFPRWWWPDRFIMVATIPKTGVGKTDKRRLRAMAAGQAEG